LGGAGAGQETAFLPWHQHEITKSRQANEPRAGRKGAKKGARVIHHARRSIHDLSAIHSPNLAGFYTISGRLSTE